MVKKWIVILAVFAGLALGNPWLALSGEPPAQEYSLAGELSVNYHGYSDSKLKVGEYGPFRSGVGGGLSLSGNKGSFYFDLKGRWEDDKDQDYHIKGDISRILRFEGDLNQFVHRFYHDLMTPDTPRVTRLVGTPSSPVTHTDHNLGRDYYIKRTETQGKMELVLPYLPGIKFKVGYRELNKDGYRQSTMLNFCSAGACHVNSYSQRVDQNTQDLTLGAEARLAFLSLAYSHLQRNFDENADAPTHLYQVGSASAGVGIPGLRPGNPVTAPFAQVPDGEGRTDALKARLDFPANTSFFAGLIDGSRDNNYNNSKVEFNTTYARISSTPMQPLTLSAGALYQSIDNDVPSSISRDVNRRNLDLVYRVWKSTSLRLGGEFEGISRTNFSEAPDTDSKTLKLGLNSRLLKGLNAQFRYKYKLIDDPGFHVEPTRSHNPFLSLTWTPKPRLSFSASYNYLDEKNKDVARTNRDNTLTLSTWFNPYRELSVTLAYTLRDALVKSGLTFGMDGAADLPYIYKFGYTPFKDRSNSYLLALAYPFSEKLHLSADFQVTNSKAYFDSSDVTNLWNAQRGLYENGTDIGDFTRMKILETEVSLGGEYTFSPVTSLELKYTFRDYNDKENNTFDGRAHIINLAFVTRFW